MADLKAEYNEWTSFGVFADRSPLIRLYQKCNRKKAQEHRQSMLAALCMLKRVFRKEELDFTMAHIAAGTYAEYMCNLERDNITSAIVLPDKETQPTEYNNMMWFAKQGWWCFTKNATGWRHAIRYAHQQTAAASKKQQSNNTY